MENASTIRRRRTPTERAQILAEYHQSNLTQEAFAIQAGISCSALSSWLRKAAAPPEAVGPKLVAVPNLFSAGRPAAAYRLQWPDGFNVEVGTGFAPAELSALLQVVHRL